MRKRGASAPAVTARVRRPVELASLYDDLNSAGHQWHTRVLSFAVVTASGSTARALSIPPGAAVYAIERLRYARNIPVASIRYKSPPPSSRSPRRTWNSGACTRSCAATVPSPGLPARPSAPGRQQRPRHGYWKRSPAPRCSRCSARLRRARQDSRTRPARLQTVLLHVPRHSDKQLSPPAGPKRLDDEPSDQHLRRGLVLAGGHVGVDLLHDALVGLAVLCQPDLRYLQALTCGASSSMAAPLP